MPRNRDQDLLRQVGLRVAQSRASRGWTQEQLSEAIGIEPVSLSRLETGHRALSLSTLNKIAEVLQVGLGDLIDPEREFSEPQHSPQEAELLRLLQSMGANRRKMLLKLARELAL